jgi:HSP20 family protein
MFELTRRPRINNTLKNLGILGKDLDDFGKLVDEMFHFHGFPTLSGLNGPDFSPSLEFAEEKDKYVATLELPGLSQNDVDISLDEDEGILTIKGEKKQEKKSERDDYYVCERAYGSFRREIPLPKNIKGDQINASFDKGILTLDLPKEEIKEKATKKIKINKIS